MSRRVLLTGATGFVGTSLTRRLLAEGWEVSAVVLPAPDADRLDERVARYELDGRTETLIAAVADARPDVVVHLASLFIAKHDATQVRPLIEANVLLGAQILEAMQAGGVSALVNTGTSWQHFEGADYDPVCLYAATKQAFEDIAGFYVNARGMRMQTLSLFDTYGPEDPRPKLFKLLRDTATSHSAPLMMSPGDQLIDLVHIDDVVSAFLVAIDRVLSSDPGTNETWAVSSGAALPLRDLVALWESVAGFTGVVEWGARPYREREVMTPWKGPAPPEWKPGVSLADGLRDVERIESGRGDRD